MTETVRTIKDAAAEIVALINARPTSPSQDEIEAVLAKVLPTAPERGRTTGPGHWARSMATGGSSPRRSWLLLADPKRPPGQRPRRGA
jgi:hypothetical protein